MSHNINKGVKEYRKNKKAVLVDVRTQKEFDSKHIAGSINIPLQSLEKILLQFKDCSIPLYVYCHSGARSAKAALALRRMGYVNVTDIGGIEKYIDEKI